MIEHQKLKTIFSSITSPATCLVDARGSDNIQKKLQAAEELDNYVEELKTRMEPDLNQCFQEFQQHLVDNTPNT